MMKDILHGIVDKFESLAVSGNAIEGALAAKGIITPHEIDRRTASGDQTVLSELAELRAAIDSLPQQ
jgi:hypothetical protein